MTDKKTIRLIHRGQLLKQDENTLSDYGIFQQSVFIHCALSDPIVPTNTIDACKKKQDQKKPSSLV